MANRTLVLIVAALGCFAAACVARQPPWKLYGRPPCADLEERIERGHARIAELSKDKRKEGEAAWYRDDVLQANRELARCKAKNARPTETTAGG